MATVWGMPKWLILGPSLSGLPERPLGNHAGCQSGPLATVRVAGAARWQPCGVYKNEAGTIYELGHGGLGWGSGARKCVRGVQKWAGTIYELGHGGLGLGSGARKCVRGVQNWAGTIYELGHLVPRVGLPMGQ